VIDEIVPEPKGGAHRDHDGAAKIVKERILFHLNQLCGLDGQSLIDQRIEKYGKMGFFRE
jgi:acetyl-CoA carboxylase carboxyl transferase subunit alpha